jgi:aspartyl-tRNA(Asn)/glutamyl-tRNA(Gln) amidotransferase subunit A
MAGEAARTVDLALDAIDADDGAINSMITVTADQAREDAIDADHATAAGRWLGLLHGMPIAIKDNIQTAGVHTTSGSLLYADTVPNQDAFVVERLRRAGAVIVGKANLQELAFGIRSVNPVSGQCRNPWDQSRIPGGSSGGSGAAVAAGFCQAALGTDTGGSVRLPAAMTGVAGLRPSHGRISNHGSTPLSPSFDTIGPLARTVSDLARLFAVMAAPDRRDPYCDGPPLENFLPSLDQGVQGLRIGVPRNHYFEVLDPDVAQCTAAALAEFEGLGATLVDVDMAGAEETHAAASVIVFSDACAHFAADLEQRPEAFSKSVYERMTTGQGYSSVDYANAMRIRETWRQTLARLFETVDIIASPTTPAPAPPIDDGKNLLAATRDASRNTYAGGLSGVPGLSLPCGFTRDRLPVGLQLEAAWWQEPLLLRAGVAYQQATAWHLEKPTPRSVSE